jgi:MFS family permease
LDESNPRYEGWRVTAACGVSLYFATLVVYTFPILLKPLSKEFSWSREAVSSAYGTMTAMSAIAAAPFGYLADRLGPRKIIGPCLAIGRWSRHRPRGRRRGHSPGARVSRP